MKGLKITLWIAALGCLTAVPFVIMPWGVVENLALWFGVDPLPNTPLVIYLFRVVCGIFGLIGIYYILLARDPLAYGHMLELATYGLILFGLLSLFVGSSIGLPVIVYIGDGLSGLILGTLATVFAYKVKRASGS